MSYAKERRLEWIDVCRELGIILVVLGHAHPPLHKLIYGFHMPLFSFFQDICIMIKVMCLVVVYMQINLYIHK